MKYHWICVCYLCMVRETSIDGETPHFYERGWSFSFLKAPSKRMG